MGRVGAMTLTKIKDNIKLGDLLEDTLENLNAKVSDATVCSETEADGKITTHGEDVDAHHAPFTTGSYVGDNSDNRAIPHGLGVIPKLVLILGSTYRAGMLDNTMLLNVYSDANEAVTAWDTTNFYVSQTTVYMNVSEISYHWIAFP